VKVCHYFASLFKLLTLQMNAQTILRARTATRQVARRGFSTTRPLYDSPFHYPEGPRSNLPFNPKTKFFWLRYWGFMGKSWLLGDIQYILKTLQRPDSLFPLAWLVCSIAEAGEGVYLHGHSVAHLQGGIKGSRKDIRRRAECMELGQGLALPKPESVQSLNKYNIVCKITIRLPWPFSYLQSVPYAGLPSIH